MLRVITGIKTGINNGDNVIDIARKVYLSYGTEVFIGDEDTEFYIKNSIKSKFGIPFNSIQVVGSSKTGVSFVKNRKFVPKISDLDIAVISAPLFNVFSEKAHEETDGYTDLTKFPIFKKQSTDGQFRKTLSSGFLNPFFMPKCELRKSWLEFFLELSNNHFEKFKNINGGIYSSEYFFEYKQIEMIKKYLNNPKKYDQISS